MYELTTSNTVQGRISFAASTKCRLDQFRRAEREQTTSIDSRFFLFHDVGAYLGLPDSFLGGKRGPNCGRPL